MGTMHKGADVAPSTDAPSPASHLMSCDVLVGETSSYADYVFPDQMYLERWEFHGSHPSVAFKIQPVRNPAIDPIRESIVMSLQASVGPELNLLEESPEHWRSMILTNVLGVALTIRATLPHLLEKGGGHFLITGSVAGRRALPGSLYSSTKWAVTGIGESLRAELRQMHENHRIRVTLIEPGMVDTPFFDNRPGPDRALHDEDIARAALYALSQPERVDVNEILIRPTHQAT